MLIENHRFKMAVKEEGEKWRSKTDKELRDTGFKMQEALFDRQAAIEKAHNKFVEDLDRNSKDIQDMALQLEKEYKEFTVQRFKWKSDFSQAANKQANHVSQIENIVSSCVKQNEYNTKAIKMILDTQMIDHII